MPVEGPDVIVGLDFREVDDRRFRPNAEFDPSTYTSFIRQRLLTLKHIPPPRRQIAILRPRSKAGLTRRIEDM